MPVIPVQCAPDSGGGVDGCCSPSITSTPLCLPDGSVILVVARSVCGTCGGGDADPQVAGWIDPATGVFTAGPAPAGAGRCGDDCASVVVLRLCDQTPDGECVPFLRHLVHDCSGAVVASSDTGPDGVSTYTPVGTVGDCTDCPCEPCTKVLPLCDYLGPGPESVQFLRTIVYDCDTGAVVEQSDTLLDGVTPYTPVGEVGECGQCRPTLMCAQLVGLSGPDSWVMPDGAESVSVSVACGPVTITDCTGSATVVNECGTSFQWAAPPVDCRPGRLCAPFTVDVPDGAAVYINFLTPCDSGDVS